MNRWSHHGWSSCHGGHLPLQSQSCAWPLVALRCACSSKVRLHSTSQACRPCCCAFPMPVLLATDGAASPVCFRAAAASRSSCIPVASSTNDGAADAFLPCTSNGSIGVWFGEGTGWEGICEPKFGGISAKLPCGEEKIRAKTPSHTKSPSLVDESQLHRIATILPTIRHGSTSHHRRLARRWE